MTGPADRSLDEAEFARMLLTERPPPAELAQALAAANVAVEVAP